jgi:hypothetical protein
VTARASHAIEYRAAHAPERPLPTEAAIVTSVPVPSVEPSAGTGSRPARGRLLWQSVRRCAVWLGTVSAGGERQVVADPLGLLGWVYPAENILV